METTQIIKRKYYTKQHKIKILEELDSHDMTISDLARRHDIHPMTVYKWRRKKNMARLREQATKILALMAKFHHSVPLLTKAYTYLFKELNKHNNKWRLFKDSELESLINIKAPEMEKLFQSLSLDLFDKKRENSD